MYSLRYTHSIPSSEVYSIYPVFSFFPSSILHLSLPVLSYHLQYSPSILSSSLPRSSPAFSLYYLQYSPSIPSSFSLYNLYPIQYYIHLSPKIVSKFPFHFPVSNIYPLQYSQSITSSFLYLFYPPQYSVSMPSIILYLCLPVFCIYPFSILYSSPPASFTAGYNA